MSVSPSDGEVMENDVKWAKPFGKIYCFEISTIFRALANAAIATEAFTNRQNYGPAIQQLIYALGELCEDYAGCEFDLPKLADALGKICDRLDADDFESDDDVELKNDCIYLWDHITTSDQRLKYYANPYSQDAEQSPAEAKEP